MHKKTFNLILSVSDYAYLGESLEKCLALTMVFKLIDDGIARDDNGHLFHDDGIMHSTLELDREALYRIYLLNRLLNGQGYTNEQINQAHQLSITMHYMTYQMLKTADVTCIQHDKVIARLAQKLGVDTDNGMAKALLRGMDRSNIWFNGSNVLARDWFLFTKGRIEAETIIQWFAVELGYDVDSNKLTGKLSPDLKTTFVKPAGSIYEIRLDDGTQRHLRDVMPGKVDETLAGIDMLAQYPNKDVYYRWVEYK